MGAGDFDKWNELVIERADTLGAKKKRAVPKRDGNPPPKDGDGSKNKGTLKIDATVTGQKIAFPTDAGLLNTARKECGRMIDLLYRQSGIDKKPRDHRSRARTEYLAFSKKRRKTKKDIRKFIRRQLGYVKRALAHIEKLLDAIETLRGTGKTQGMFPEMPDPYPCRFPLPERDQRIYWAVQQQYMYDERTNSVEDRITNIYQPYVRPIPRGKDGAKTEFGAKISASEVDGFARAEHISWDQYNEAMDLTLQVEMYRKTYGHWPELLLADRI